MIRKRTKSRTTANERGATPRRPKRRSLLLLLAVAMTAAGGGLLSAEPAATAKDEAVAPDVCPNPAPFWCDRGGEDYRCLDGKMAYRGCVDITVF